MFQYKTFASDNEVETEIVNITDSLKNGLWTGGFEGSIYYVRTNLIDVDFITIDYLGLASFERVSNSNQPVVRNISIELSKNDIVLKTIVVPKTDHGSLNEFVLRNYDLTVYENYQFNLKIEMNDASGILGTNGGSLRIQTDESLFAYSMRVVKNKETFPIDPEQPEEPIEVDDLGELSTFDTLPLTTGGFSSIEDKTKVGQVKFYDGESGKYHIQVTYNNKKYVVKDVVLPGVSELKKAPINSGIYYTQNGERHLYYEFQNEASSSEISENLIYDKEQRIYGFRPFVIWNATTGQYQVTNQLRLYGTIYTDKREAYVDVLFPMHIDDLLSITFNYELQYKYGIFGKGDIKEHITTRTKDDYVNQKGFWSYYKDHIFFRDWKSWVFGLNFFAYESITKAQWDETITNISSLASSVQYQNDYVNKLNKVLIANKKPTVTRSIFASETLYRVYLGTFDYGLSTSFEIMDNYSILDVMYELDGEYFHVPMDDIDFDGVGGGSEDDLDNVIGMFDSMIKKIMKFMDRATTLFGLVENNPGVFIAILLSIIGLVLFAPALLGVIIRLLVVGLSWIIRFPILLIYYTVKGIASLFSSKKVRQSDYY